jgi:alkylated DNA repair dioxygenase AlkB
MEIILAKDGLAEYYSNFLSTEETEDYFYKLKTEIDWQSDQLIIFGKVITTKRKVAWYGDEAYEYVYSKNMKVAKPWTKTLRAIKEHLERFSGEKFNSCLLNYYHDGSEGMGWHSDNEVMMKKNAAIASISLGATRKFNFRHKASNETQSVFLESGSLIMMKGEVQTYWKHKLPVSKKILTPRINLTFRYFEDHED